MPKKPINGSYGQNRGNKQGGLGDNINQTIRLAYTNPGAGYGPFSYDILNQDDTPILYTQSSWYRRGDDGFRLLVGDKDSLIQLVIKEEITEIAEEAYSNCKRVNSRTEPLYIHDAGILIGSRAFQSYGHRYNRLRFLKNADIREAAFQSAGIGGDLDLDYCVFTADLGRWHFNYANFSQGDNQWKDLNSKDAPAESTLTMSNCYGDIAPGFARSSCGLKKVDITSWQHGFRIDSTAFAVTNLQEVYFPENLKTIETEAFFDCELSGDWMLNFRNCTYFGDSCFEEAFVDIDDDDYTPKGVALLPFATDSGQYSFWRKAFYNSKLDPQSIMFYNISGMTSYKRSFDSLIKMPASGQGYISGGNPLLIANGGNVPGRWDGKMILGESSFANNYFSSYHIAFVDFIGPNCFANCRLGKETIETNPFYKGADVYLEDVASVGGSAFYNFDWGWHGNHRVFDQPVMKVNDLNLWLLSDKKQRTTWSPRVFYTSSDPDKPNGKPAAKTWLPGWSTGSDAMVLGTEDINEYGTTLGQQIYDVNGKFAMYYRDSFQTLTTLMKMRYDGIQPAFFPDCPQEGLRLSGNIFEAPSIDEDYTDEEPFPDIVPDLFDAVVISGVDTYLIDYAYRGERTAEESGDPYNWYDIRFYFETDPAVWEYYGLPLGAAGWIMRADTAFYSDQGYVLVNQNDDPRTPAGTFTSISNTGICNVEVTTPAFLAAGEAVSAPPTTGPLGEGFELWVNINDPQYTHDWEKAVNFYGFLNKTGVLEPQDPESPE